MRSGLLTIAIALLFTVPGFAKDYKIGMIHWIAYSPLNVADVKGFWKEQGLNVEVVNFGSNQELNGALEHKKIDIACDMMGSWAGLWMNGVPLKIIGETDWSNGGDKIIVKKGLAPDSLKGQPVGIYLDQPSVTFFLNKYLSAQGLKLSDAKATELEPETLAENFIAGRFKAIVNYDPQALKAEREGGGEVAATSASYPGVIPEGFVARADVLQGIPKDDLKKIFTGWIKAVAWSKDAAHWPEYMAILNAKTFAGEPPYPEKDLRDMLAAVKIHDAKEQLARNESGLPAYLAELRVFLKDNGLLKKDFQPADLLAVDALVETLKALKP